MPLNFEVVCTRKCECQVHSFAIEDYDRDGEVLGCIRPNGSITYIHLSNWAKVDIREVE